LDREGRTIWIAYTHRGGKRFVVRADEKLTAFVELESAIRDDGVIFLDQQPRFSQNWALLKRI
jgi:hypothetical protein